MVTSGVGDDSIVKDVEFTHAPSVESLLRVETVEHGLITDLNIANSSSDASNLGPFGYRP